MQQRMSQNQRNIWILFFTLIVVMLGFGIIIPILPFYMEQFGVAGSALGGLMATFGLMQFLFAPVWGNLSDRIGRKPVLLLGVFGNALAHLLTGFSTELWMVFAGRALGGILSSATLPTAMAYVSDSTTHAERGGKMGMIGASLGIGLVLGPGLGGLVSQQSLSTPFFIAAALSLMALVLIFLLLPEPAREMQPHKQDTREPQIKRMWLALAGPLGILFLMSFLLSFGVTNFEGIFGLYTKTRYGFSPQQVGGVLVVVGLVSAVIQGGLTGPMIRRWGENKVVRASLLGSALGFVLMTQAQNGWQVLVTGGFFVFCNAMLNPTVASLISKRTAHAQGLTMGLNNAFLSLGRIVGPLWAGFAFDFRINLPYLSGAAIMVAGLIVALRKLKDDE